jgi:parvulin-like peptidyl-prolyl isomerase
MGSKMTKLLTVNNQSFDITDAIRRSMTHREDLFLDLCIEELLIRQYAKQKNIINSDEEIKLAAEELRYQNGLELIENLKHWIKSNNQTISSLKNGLDHLLLRNKVRSSISEQDIEAYFAEHKLEFDKVKLYSIRLKTQQEAEEIYARIVEEDENFHILAMEHSIDEDSRAKAGYIGVLFRDEVTAEIEAAVFNTQPGKILEPLKTDKGYNLFKVDAIYPASLEEERSSIRFKLFNQLLAKLRAEAKIAYPILEEEN